MNELRGLTLVSVIIADDHDLVRAGISRMLADVSHIQVVGEANSGEQALELVKKLHPDVVLMDVKMPGIGGLEATRKVLKQAPGTKVIILTVCEEEPFPSKCLRAGAAGYLTKGAALNEVVSAIDTVSRGQRYVSPEIAQLLALRSFSDGGESPFDQLSERELQVAMMIVECKKVQEISDTLFLSPKTINTYRYRVFDKLGVSSDVELALLAVRHGMIDASTPA